MDDLENQKISELRRAPGRWVELDRARGVVTKGFRGRTAWARLSDRTRARREAELLGLASEAGIAAPEVLGVERGGRDSWLVRIAAVEGARTAEAALAEPAGRERLVERLARLLAQLQAAGIDQPDLHSKNALVGPDGRVWAIDFHAAHAVGPLGLGPRLCVRDLVALAASHRELLETRMRMRFLLAWYRALPVELAARLGTARELARRIEAQAMAARRGACRAYAKPSSRYFRVSGWYRTAGGDADRLLARRDADPRAIAAALAGEAHPALVVVRGTRDQIQHAWGAVARLAAHRLPGPRPLLLDRRDERDCAAWFDFHSGAAPLDLDTALEEPALPPSKAERRHLDRALEFRGLALAGELPAAFRIADGELLLSPSARVRSTSAAKRRSSEAKQARRARRRLRRKRLARIWPLLCRPPLRPLTRAGLIALAKVSRFSPLESRLRRNLARGLPERKPAELTPHIRSHMARLALEWGQLGEDPAWLEKMVTIDASVRHLDEALAAGRGAIVITPHLGNWELLAAAIVARGARGAVIGRRRLRDPSAEVLEELRARAHVETLPQDSSPRELLRRLARGEVLGILPDLEVQRLAGVRLDFLGKNALVMSAPAALARAARLPLLPARCVLDESSGKPRGTYTLSFGAPIPPPQTRAETHAVTAQWVALFEDWIRECPSQWLWVHDRWRTPPSAADKVPLGALRQVQATSRRSTE